ncbi:MAG: RNA 3'-terminal phosphate cyclase [Candidatus Bathyarchaeota archaeon]|nr:MAG: RNA 3'-terminal phosphate cyclase [Candidatus Bathyarchaeota archaeon]
MLEIDGSRKSGSGTILRVSIALATVQGKPLHIFNIREKRPQPGLKPQHAEAVLVAAKICGGRVKGATVGSRELWFYPGEIVGGSVYATIGTAGSIPMLLVTILPICSVAKNRVHLTVARGGTDVAHSPTINYLRYIFLPVLSKMGFKAKLTVKKYGYFPKGLGEVAIEIQPNLHLTPICLENFGTIKYLKGISVCTFLANRRVADRQAQAAEEFLDRHRLKADIRVVNDFSNKLQKGSSLVLWAETDTGVLLGGDAIGELRKPSEKVGEEAAITLFTEVSAKATVDSHLSDMLIPYLALTNERSVFLTRRITEHLETNIWLAQKILDVDFRCTKSNGLWKLEKM